MNKLTKLDGRSKLELGLMFVMYQVIGIWVTLKVAPNLTASALNFLHLFGRQHVRADYYWILFGTPFFPVQVGVGLVFGWILAGIFGINRCVGFGFFRLRSSAMPL